MTRWAGSEHTERGLGADCFPSEPPPPSPRIPLTLHPGYACSTVWAHRSGTAEGFTKRYGLKLLVWYETHATMEQAITREKQIKAWKRAWKVKLIERMNPTWADLYEDLNR
jgi:predicted GIY-YIG superfamily endonuclease